VEESGPFRGLARRLGRRGRGDAALSGPGLPFTDQEIHQLAFGLPEQWLGIINRERWRSHGAAVMAAWEARVEADGAEHDRNASAGHTRDEITPRSAPWPVIFYGKPDRAP
jgi:hypothetical protein